MALLASCWLITESFIIPDGFIKWFYLSFYIHPFFLFFCQFFLWLNVLKKWLMVFCSPCKVVFLFVFKFIERVVVFLFSFITSSDDQIYYDVLDLPADLQHIPLQDYEIVVACNKTRVQAGVFCWINQSDDVIIDSCLVEEIIDHKNPVLDSWLNQYLYSDHFCMSEYNTDTNTNTNTNTDSDTDIDVDTDIDIGTNESIINQDFVQETENTDIDIDTNIDIESNESIKNQDFIQDTEDTLLISQERDISSPGDSYTIDDRQMIIRATKDEEIDPFHQKYTSRMRFFNLLYHERLHGMSVILRTVGSEFIVWDRMDRKRILKSLEYDLEMICVAQSCLLWEALHHQYQKIETLTFSENNNTGNNYVLFQRSVTGKFQELEILMERFVEDQKCCNDMQKRLSFQALLQVPDATGLMFIEEEMGGEGMRASEVLEAISSCIEAFWMYIQTDHDNKSSSLWRININNPTTVEDPQDLELLHLVTKTLHKKGSMIKNMQGKTKCWLRKKVKPLQAEAEDEKKNLVFAMIDMKLVQRLLKMSLVSTSHLNWCQQKLNNLDFKDEKVCRGCNSILFPTS